MIASDFVFYNRSSLILDEGLITWKAPSNIAIVKYWGKTKPQIPKNTSLSFTLNESYTQSNISFQKSDKLGFEVKLDGVLKPEFAPKIESFFKHILEYCPYLNHYHFKIDTHNSFPHSSGIASSASGFAALALCVMSIEKMLNPNIENHYFLKKAAFLARLGSGSATRSIQGSHVIWGIHSEINHSSNLYGQALQLEEVHDVFKNYQDTILLIHKGRKQVSSTMGHQLMNNHPFAKNRFKQAQHSIIDLLDILKKGDLEPFIKLMESEALTLHAMMMTANPYFILMHPNTLEAIHKIWQFRNDSKLPIGFTLDAGANVHIMYPKSISSQVKNFIDSELAILCENNQYICDCVGQGAKQIK